MGSLTSIDSSCVIFFNTIFEENHASDKINSRHSEHHHLESARQRGTHCHSSSRPASYCEERCSSWIFSLPFDSMSLTLPWLPSVVQTLCCTAPGWSAILQLQRKGLLRRRHQRRLLHSSCLLRCPYTAPVCPALPSKHLSAR